MMDASPDALDHS